VKKLLALYGPPDDPDQFARHYREVHTPLTLAMPGLRRLEVGRVAGEDGPYHLVAEMTFDGQEQLDAALASEEGAAAVADLDNFATGGCTVLVLDVEEAG